MYCIRRYGGGVAQADDEGEAMARLDCVGGGIITPSSVLTVVIIVNL